MPIGAPRLKGQEIQLLVLDGANRVDEIRAVSSLDTESKLELKQDGFLGETTDEFDMVYSGEGGGFEIQIHNAKLANFKQRIIEKARRIQPTITFNIVYVELFANGDSTTTTFTDVSFGPITTNVANRKDYVKAKFTFACSEAPVQVNAFV